MSKGLEALYSGIEVNTKEYGNCIAYTQDCIDIIEKELKALEIIKTKRVDVNMLIIYETYLDWLDYYGQDLPKNMWLTQEEFLILEKRLDGTLCLNARDYVDELELKDYQKTWWLSETKEE